VQGSDLAFAYSLPTIGFHPLSFGMPGGPIHPFPIGCPVCPRRAFTRAVWLTLRLPAFFPPVAKTERKSSFGFDPWYGVKALDRKDRPIAPIQTP
jgi:hypothetical protein